jgi:hypothetical protein
MPTTEATDRVQVSTPSRLRAQLNIAAAVVALFLCLVILALLAHTSRPGAAHHLRPAGHTCSVC